MREICSQMWGKYHAYIKKYDAMVLISLGETLKLNFSNPKGLVQCFFNQFFFALFVWSGVELCGNEICCNGLNIFGGGFEVKFPGMPRRKICNFCTFDEPNWILLMYKHYICYITIFTSK